MRKLLAIIAASCAFAFLGIPAAADSGSGYAPFPICHPAIPANAFGPGQPPVALASTGPCQETDHFGLSAFIAGPGGPCPPPFPGLIAVLGQGNGISHSNVNAADDWWATSTFEGTADVHAFFGFDSNGAPILGPLLATGHQMQWFGNSFNASNFVLHDTGNISLTTLTTPAQTFSLHFADHQSSTGGNPYIFGVPPFDEPNHTVFMKSTC
jgi:hypothetical protein